MSQRKVTAIPATISRFTAVPVNSIKKRRVAGYARVSTDHEEQATSYEAQVDYYTKYIKSRDDWEFVKVYTDEGITATNTKRREGFKNMVTDALAGKIDLIVTKSVSRFARNTVDSLTTVRKLKDKGIEIYFEKENIWTLDAKGELLITIMSSLAQEESRSISENVTWGQRKRLADGKVSFAYSTFLGLDKDEETGKIVINPEQAEIVRLIYRLFLSGMSPHSIAKELMNRGIKTVKGKDIWRAATVQSILTNEKYKGDALLQKCFTVDFLQKKRKKNEGEVPQFYVEGNHEAIINPEAFDMVQAEFDRRRKAKLRHSGVDIFSSKIKCGDCGAWYGAKVWCSNTKYRRTVYICNKKYVGKKCETPHVKLDELKAAFVSAFNQLVTEKKEIIANLRIVLKTVCQTGDLQKEKNRLEEELAVLAETMNSSVKENAHLAQNQNEYQKRYNRLVEKYDAVKDQYDKVSDAITAKEMQGVRLENFIKSLKAQDGIIQEFDDRLWGILVDFVTVSQDKKFTVTFKDGTEIQA